MVRHVGESIPFQMASTNPMMKMGTLSPISIFGFALLLSTYAWIAAAQTNNATTFQNVPLLPSACTSAITPEEQRSCEEALYADIDILADYYTIKFAEQFGFCVIDPLMERNAAFDFSANLSFLSKCLYDTEGYMLNRFCSGVEITSYLAMLVNVVQSSQEGKTTPLMQNVNCNETHWSQGCEDGWSMQILGNVDTMNALYFNHNLNILRSYSTIAPCCDGFYCPRGLACMIPCPLGAQCPKASYNASLCSPYDYQLTPAMNFSCGGANMWADYSNSEGIFCPAGFYCPSTNDIRQCDSGHYCREGSTVQSKCFQLISCDEQAATQHLQTYGVMLIVGLCTILLLIYNCSDQVMHIREKQKMKSREKAVQQVREHLNAMERWRFAVDAARRLSRTFSRRPSRSGEEMQVLAPPGLPRSTDGLARVDTIDEDRSYYERKHYDRSTAERRIEPYTDQPVEEDLYEPVEVAPVDFLATDGKGATTSKPRVPQTTSQILRYAYGQIEREKKVQNKKGWHDVVSQTSQNEERRGERFKIEITFQDLSLSLKGTGKKILCNVTGKLLPGHVTAVMGPSGAGKTTFLNALAGKAYNSTTSGVVLINGKPDPIRCYRKVIGFVPQDDIVHGNLTVEENLWFSARYRLPIDMPKAEKVLVVERIIDALGLGSIRNSRVGTVERRGISGGQRKRVNVGLEMVMAPSLLILDEPTSGLDSTSSQLVLRALRREAFVGVNVGVVLHQPSYGLFKMFDDVMFLAKGGRAVYLGPVDDVENYFAAMGIVVPERINPPDHFMDILEGISKPEGNPHFDPKILPVKWMRYNNYNIPEDLQATVLEMDVPLGKTVLENQVSTESSRMFGKTKTLAEDLWEEAKAFLELHWDDFKGAFTRSEDLSNRRLPGFFRQFKLIIFRLALQRFREARVQAQDYLILLLTGACLGLITPTKDSSLGSNNYTYVIIALSLLCMIAALRTFSNDKLQFWRESASSINRVAYFLAKDTVDHFNTLIKPVVFLSLFYFFNNPRSTFVENYIVTIALVYCVVGLAYIFAITLESGPAQLWAVFLPIIFTLLSTKKSESGIIKILQYCTYTRWVLEAYVITNAKRYSGVWLITRCVALYGFDYDIRHWALCLAVLFLMGFLARCVALLCLILCNRKRQQ